MSPVWSDVRILPGLHFVATPLGNARDITLRALDTLANADVLAAEDTRRLRQLMDIHAVPLKGRRIVAYHDHNGPKVRPVLLEALKEGKSVAYASDAGSPLVADPGFVLGREAIAAGLAIPFNLVRFSEVPGVSTRERVIFLEDVYPVSFDILVNAEKLAELTDAARDELRERLAAHFTRMVLPSEAEE